MQLPFVVLVANKHWRHISRGRRQPLILVLVARFWYCCLLIQWIIKMLANGFRFLFRFWFVVGAVFSFGAPFAFVLLNADFCLGIVCFAIMMPHHTTAQHTTPTRHLATCLAYNGICMFQLWRSKAKATTHPPPKMNNRRITRVWERVWGNSTSAVQMEIYIH